MTDEQLELCEGRTPSKFVVGILTKEIRRLREDNRCKKEMIADLKTHLIEIDEENERLRTAVVVAEDHLRSHYEVVHPVLDETIRKLGKVK